MQSKLSCQSTATNDDSIRRVWGEILNNGFWVVKIAVALISGVLCSSLLCDFRLLTDVNRD